ncbi:MAG: alpha/beta fold hydrolase [Pseudomonadota bacterium]
MRAALRWLRNIVVLLVVVIGGLWLFGPREPIETEITFDASGIGDDIDAYLTERESRFTDITAGTAKRVVWAGEPGAQTYWAVVNIHGFSATSEEIRPVPDKVAEALGANLYYTRLVGHGRGAAAMSEPSMGDWMNDLAEALAIGKRLGKRVLVITTSTGGTLATSAALDPALRAQMDGVVLISPNFGPVDPMAELVNWPLARQWVPAVAGADRSWEPHNDQQGVYWTTSYQTVAVMPMMAAVKHARSLDHSAIDLPALFIYSAADTVVSAEKTDAVYGAWGGNKDRLMVTVGPEDDPSSHVIAGDILSPSQNAPTIEAIITWAGGL